MFTIYDNLIKIIRGKFYTVSTIITLTIFQSFILVYISSINFSIMESVENNDNSNALFYLTLMASLECGSCLIRFARSTLFVQKLLIPSNEQFKRRFMTILFLDSDPTWINENKPSEIYQSIENGSKAMNDILVFITEISNPIIKSIGGLLIIQYHMNSLISIIILMGTIFYLGSKIMYEEYHKLKKVNKKTNPLNSYNSHLTNTFLTSLLNGSGYNTTETIISNSIMNKKMHTEISLRSRKNYVALEIFGILGVLVSIILMTSDINASKLIALSWNLNGLLSEMWRLFRQFANVSKSAAKWAMLESFLIDRIPIRNENDEIETFEINGITANEFHIDGESGSGKSRWLTRTVIDLFQKFRINWVVVPQKFNVPVTSCITIREFLKVHNELDTFNSKILLQYAELLRLDSIINDFTLDQPFVGVSGGEERRIGFLKHVLPIFTKEKQIKIIFLDEVSAGLDEKSRLAVRKVIEQLKDLGIIVVNIDHNKFESKCVTRIPVKQL